MKPTFQTQGDTLIAILRKPDIDLALIKNQMTETVHHLIFDLSKLQEISDVVLQNFTTFGNQLTGKNSFVMVLDGSFKEQFPIVPTIEEAFDYIEMENIERALNF
jgi:hypothetical protein